GCLIKPFQFTRIRIERQNAIGVQVVSLAVVAVVVVARIAGWPEQRFGLRVVNACEPSDRAPMLDSPAMPGIGRAIAGRRYRPEAPYLLAGGLIECGQKSPCAL